MANEKKTNYPEIDDIKEDLESLKTNVVELTKHVQENGTAKTQELRKKLIEGFVEFQGKSKREVEKVEKQIKANPLQSLMIAFTAGLIASLVLGSRK